MAFAVSRTHVKSTQCCTSLSQDHTSILSMSGTKKLPTMDNKRSHTPRESLKHTSKEQNTCLRKKEAGKKVTTLVNMSRASAGLTLITVQVFDQNDELVNVITTTSTTAHINGSNIKIIKDDDVNTFGKREYK